MASVSSTTSSLGNTSLRGYGGLASGIDRDAIIESLSEASNTKIQNKKDEITKLEWKQEAFRNITDQILDLEDNYLTYSSSSSVLDAELYEKTVVNVMGNDSSTKYVTAGGSSDWVSSMSILGVTQLATAASLQSAKMEGITQSTKLSELGIIASSDEAVSAAEEADAEDTDEAVDEEDSVKYLDFKINGVSIEGLTEDSTVSDMINAINNSNAGVKAMYLSSSNTFALMTTSIGSESKIELGGVAEKIFGGDGSTYTAGKDAVMYVDYGFGTAERVTSSTNTFDLEGLSVTVTGTFGGAVEPGEGEDSLTPASFDTSQSITFSLQADVDTAVERVKQFIEDYNALVEAIHTQISTKPDSDYGPLTDEQKDEMDDTSIENWENKAKSGILYNNDIMRDLSMDMESVLNKVLMSGISYDDLEDIGITMSEDLYDGGKLVFDESAFRTAMEQNPEKVSKVMAGSGDGESGLVSIINNTTKQYATRYAYKNNGSYGRLAEEAGTEKLSLTLTDNSIYTQLKEKQEELETLKTRLESEQERYIDMFTRMETAISNMNSQSSYLSSLTG